VTFSQAERSALYARERPQGADDFAPEIAANNKVLYFASSRPGGGSGSVNIWISKRDHQDGLFGEPMSLDDINGPIFQAKASISGFSEIFWWPFVQGVSGTLISTTRRDPSDTPPHVGRKGGTERCSVVRHRGTRAWHPL
jgi:hypothetical protein